VSRGSGLTGGQASASASAARGLRQRCAAAGGEQQPLRNIGPEPKRFEVAEGQLSSIAAAGAPFLLRAGTGGFNSGYRVALQADDGGPGYAVLRVGGRKVVETSDVGGFPRPAQPLEIYEFEGCPFCRKVREAVSVLDLDVLFRPCPKGGSAWRPQAVALGGKAQFPYLVDPNTGKAMYESDDIISYLFATYGDGKVPLMLRLGPITSITAALALAPRAGRGNTARPSRQPAAPLTLWGYELSPFVKVVKEVLCELELPYVQRTCARGSPKRQELLDKVGHFQVPYLEDPNEGVCLFESSAIIKYLEDTYAVRA